MTFWWQSLSLEHAGKKKCMKMRLHTESHTWQPSEFLSLHIPLFITLTVLTKKLPSEFWLMSEVAIASKIHSILCMHIHILSGRLINSLSIKSSLERNLIKCLCLSLSLIHTLIHSFTLYIYTILYIARNDPLHNALFHVTANPFKRH